MKRVVLLFILSFIIVFGSSIHNLTIFTEEYPPFNYQNSKTGSLEGIYVDIVDYILKDINSNLTRNDIQLVPWARGYRTTLGEKDTAIFAITWTEERDPLFKWVGPVTPNKQVLIAKKDKNITINSVADLKNYNIGVVRDDIAEQLLRGMGLTDQNIHQVHTPVLNARMIDGGRIDMWAYGEGVARHILRTTLGSAENYETVYVLTESEMYIGFNPETSDEVIATFQKSLDKLKTQDKDIYNNILDKYLR